MNQNFSDCKTGLDIVNKQDLLKAQETRDVDAAEQAFDNFWIHKIASSFSMPLHAAAKEFYTYGTSRLPPTPQKGNTMNQTELFKELAAVTNLTEKEVKSVFTTYASFVTEDLRETGELLLPGLGIFRKADRPERMGRNPGTGESIKIAAKSVVKFIVKKSLKDAVMK